jgi:hypothetical protein
MRSVVKVSWKKNKKGEWKADLLLAESGGFERWTLSPERSFSFEVTDERRCTGFAPAKGERSPCPEFRKISSGSQCPECRGKDIYSDYVRGDTQTDLDGEFSVYMVQISDQVKVGVTKSGNCMNRWVEQGADYGAKILEGLSSKVALENEQRISSNGTAERISKRNKTETSTDPGKLKEKLESENFEADIVDVQEKTVYPRMETSSFQRKGLFEGELKAVKGQILSNGRLAMGMTSGKVVKNPEQKGLSSF